MYQENEGKCKVTERMNECSISLWIITISPFSMFFTTSVIVMLSVITNFVVLHFPKS